MLPLTQPRETDGGSTVLAATGQDGHDLFLNKYINKNPSSDLREQGIRYVLA
jgi:hypothetical protein